MPFIVPSTPPAVEQARQLGPYRAGGGARPGALESRIVANGLVLNDQNAYDRYYVKAVDGLWGTDIRDQREARVNDDGEDVYDTLLGGKSVVINGRIEAHTLDIMRQMESDLEVAFPHNFDYPILFDRTSLRRRGIQSNALADKNFCTNPAVQTDTSGYSTGLGPLMSRATSFYKDINAGDYYMSVVWHPGTNASLLLHRTENVAITNGQYVQVGIDVFIPESWNGGDVQLSMTMRRSGTIASYSSQPLLSDSLASETIRGRWQRIWVTQHYEDAIDGTSVDLDLYAQGNPVDGDEIRFTAVMIRVSSDQTAVSPSYFDGETSGWRWEGTPYLSASSVDPSTYRQDVFIMARRVDKIALRDEQTNQWFKREFQIPLRLADPCIYSATTKTVSSVPGALTTLYIKNNGNYAASPRLHIVGPWTNFSIINTTLLDGEIASRRFSFTGSIPAGGYYDWNEENYTLIDNGGVHREGLVDASANGLRLRRGTNILTLGGTGLTVASQVSVSYEDTWK